MVDCLVNSILTLCSSIEPKEGGKQMGSGVEVRTGRRSAAFGVKLLIG